MATPIKIHLTDRQVKILLQILYVQVNKDPLLRDETKELIQKIENELVINKKPHPFRG